MELSPYWTGEMNKAGVGLMMINFNYERRISGIIFTFMPLNVNITEED